MKEIKNKKINYSFFHWGPYLYKTTLTKDELKDIKNLCVKDPKKDTRKNLAGLIKHEYEIDRTKLFSILLPYFESYAKGYQDYSGKNFGKEVELISSWVNYMTKFESNPIHTHDEDMSFVIFTQIPKELKQQWNDTVSSGTKPGSLNFMISLTNNKTSINQHTFQPNEGDFYIFPADLNHFVNHFETNGERVSVSGNLKIKNERKNS
tara:strand:- start:283 stop:903 length:621 start_codon:yes stop_codon:yes gene_type:complete